MCAIEAVKTLWWRLNLCVIQNSHSAKPTQLARLKIISNFVGRFGCLKQNKWTNERMNDWMRQWLCNCSPVHIYTDTNTIYINFIVWNGHCGETFKFLSNECSKQKLPLFIFILWLWAVFGHRFERNDCKMSICLLGLAILFFALPWIPILENQTNDKEKYFPSFVFASVKQSDFDYHHTYPHTHTYQNQFATTFTFLFYFPHLFRRKKNRDRSQPVHSIVWKCISIFLYHSNYSQNYIIIRMWMCRSFWSWKEEMG